MKQGLELTALAVELDRQAASKRDFIAPSDSIYVRSNGRANFYLNEPFELTETGHQNLAQYLDFPGLLRPAQAEHPPHHRRWNRGRRLPAGEPL